MVHFGGQSINQNTLGSLRDQRQALIDFNEHYDIEWAHLATRPQNLRAYQHLSVLISVITVSSFHLMDLYRDWLRRSDTWCTPSSSRSP